MNYRKHMASLKWRRSVARLGEFAAAGHRCRICNAAGTLSEPLQAHHRTYENFGVELIGDLTALCRGCHDCVTDFLRRRSYQTVDPIRSDVLLTGHRDRLFDPTREEASS